MKYMHDEVIDEIENSFKISFSKFLKKPYMRHTSNWLGTSLNMIWIHWLLWNIQSGQTDTHNEASISPQLRWVRFRGGIKVVEVKKIQWVHHASNHLLSLACLLKSLVALTGTNTLKMCSIGPFYGNRVGDGGFSWKGHMLLAHHNSIT